MADIGIPQAEADVLIAMEEHRVDDTIWLFPSPGDRLTVDLVSSDKREAFALDITRSRLKLMKVTYQNRARQAIILMRLDLDGPPHPNPEGLPAGPDYAWLPGLAGKTMPCPHLHIYVEGYGDKWAIPAPVDRYSNVQDLFLTFETFRRHCNITNPPQIEKGLFS